MSLSVSGGGCRFFGRSGKSVLRGEQLLARIRQGLQYRVWWTLCGIAHVVGTTVNDFEHRSELRHSKFPRKQVVEQRLICREHRLHLQQGVAQYDVMVESEGAHFVYPHPFGVVSVETCRGRRPYFYKGNVGDCDNAFDAYALRALKPYYVSRVACAVF